MALWALWMTAISGCGLVVTGIGVWFVKNTLDATRAALDLAQKQHETMRTIGEAPVRAYFTLSNVGVLIKDTAVELVFEVSNSGSTPAFDGELGFAINFWSHAFTEAQIDPNLPTFHFETIRQGGTPMLHTFATGVSAPPVPEGRRILVSVCMTASYRDVFNQTHRDPLIYTGAVLPNGEIAKMHLMPKRFLQQHED